MRAAKIRQNHELGLPGRKRYSFTLRFGSDASKDFPCGLEPAGWLWLPPKHALEK
jgi:hypothetical protein